MELMKVEQGLMNSSVLGEAYAGMYSGMLSYSTKRAYTVDVQQFFGVDDLSKITIADIQNVNVATARQYRELLKSRGYKESTINRKLTSLSKFYSVMARTEIGIVSYNPFDPKEGTARVRQNKRYSNTRCLSIDEVKKLLQVAMEGRDIIALRNRIIILLLATTGMRRSEMTSIKVGDIKQTRGKHIVEVYGKGEKERIVVITDTIKILIDNYLKMRGLTYKDKDAYLLTNHAHNNFKTKPNMSEQAIYDVVKAVADKAGIGADDIHPHCLRHTYATEALGMLPIQDVADLMGHSDISTTKRYDHSRRMIDNNPAEALQNMLLD